jgi:hypothetical protein
VSETIEVKADQGILCSFDGRVFELWGWGPSDRYLAKQLVLMKKRKEGKDGRVTLNLKADGAARRLELSFEAGDVPGMERLVQAMLEAGLREEA